MLRIRQGVSHSHQGGGMKVRLEDHSATRPRHVREETVLDRIVPSLFLVGLAVSVQARYDTGSGCWIPRFRACVQGAR